MSRGQLIKEGIETVLDNASKYIRSATNAVTKNKRIAKIAKERGYRRTGAGNFLPEELFYFDKTSRGGRYKLKDPDFRYKNDVEIKFDEDGVPISHTITPKTYVRSDGKVAKFDKEGKVSYYVKDPNLGVGKYTRSEKELELVRERMKEITERTKQQKEITRRSIDDFFIQNPQLADSSKINDNIVRQIRDFIPPNEIGRQKGKKINERDIKEYLEEKGLYTKKINLIPEELKERIKNYLLDGDKWKTMSSPQVIQNLNLQGQINNGTINNFRKKGFGTGKNLLPIEKGKNLDNAKAKYVRMLQNKYGGDSTSPVYNRLKQAFADYLTDAYGGGKKGGYTLDQIDEAFRFVEDTEIGINTIEGQAYQEMFETLQSINNRKLAQINADRATKGLRPLQYGDPKLDKEMWTMGHARLDSESGKMGAFDLSKVEPEIRAKNKLAYDLGKQLKKAIREDDLKEVDRIVTEMIEAGIRHEVVLPGRKFKGTGELEGFEDIIDDTFIIGGEAPEPFPLEPLADGGMVGENVLEEPMVDEEMGFYKKGGAVDATTVRPEISIEFGGEDSDLPFGYGKEENTEGGAVGGPAPVEPAPEPEKEYIGFDDVKDFLGNTMESIDEFTEGERYRLLPKIIAKGLKSPGDYADSVLSKVDQYNKTMGGAGGPLPEEDQVSKFAQAMSNPVVAGAKVFDFITIPLQEGYENMFSDEDSIYLPGYGEIKADTKFKKAIAAGATVGLTALEVLALFSPATLVRLGGLSTQAIANVMKRHYGKILTGGLIAGYETKDPFIFGDEGLISMVKGFFDENKDVQDDVAADIEKEREKARQADPLNPGGPGLIYDNKADGGLVGLPPEFTGEYAETKLALGGDPGQFTNPTPSGLEEEIDIGDYLLDPAYESVEDLDNLFDITRSAEDAFQRDSGFLDDQVVEVASRGDALKEGIKYVLGEVPNWVRQGKERVQKILPKTGDDLEQSLITTLDEGTVTRTEPGQLFYSRLEAELMQGPKVYESLDAFKKYTQSRNIGKVELFDSELERIIESAQAAGRPITRELVLGALKESPLSKVQSKGYGFLSNSLDGKQRELKYPGYKEGGALPGTDRERLLFVDPNDLRGDPGSLPSTVSPHSWEEPYTIAWSRLSDRDLGGQYAGKTVTFADEIQSDIFQSAQKTAGKLAAKIKYMADNNVPLDTINNELQRDMMTFFADKGSVYRESLPGAAELQVEMKALMDLQDQLTALKNTPVPEITDDMLDAAKNIRFQQNDIIDNMTEELNLQLVKTLYPNLPFKLRGQWADASIKRDVYEAAYRKFVLKDPDATDYYAVTPANLVTKRYSHEGSSATSRGDRAKDKAERIKRWVDGGMEGDLAPSRYPGVGMYEFYGGPGADVVTDTGKHYTSEIEKILKRIANENQVPLETLPVRISEGKREVFQVVDRNTGEVLGSGNTGRQADAIANDIIANSDRKVVVQRAEEFDTAPSFGIELTPSMAEAFKAYMAKGGLVEEEILLPYGD